MFAFCMVSSQFEGCLDRFGAGVGKEDSLAARTGSQFGEPAGEFRLWSVVEVGTGHVDESRRLFLDCFDNSRMAMSCRANRDPGVKVQKAIPIDVLDDRALAFSDSQRIGPCVGR